jgi:hypothetical protein
MDTTVLEKYAAMIFRIDTTISNSMTYLRAYVCFYIYISTTLCLGCLHPVAFMRSRFTERKEIVLIQVVEKDKAYFFYNILFLIWYGKKNYS